MLIITGSFAVQKNGVLEKRIEEKKIVENCRKKVARSEDGVTVGPLLPPGVEVSDD